ncbi:thiamine phosphate synthase [Rhodoplanes elegans]|nr:thiamine phosphate synthase [Rhodoplanes elegans]MBK5962296.1 thiamine phosphate synthase [Rhodoplanes elegans]
MPDDRQRLYLVIPVTDPAAAAARLSAALAADVDVAAVLVRLPAGLGERDAVNAVKAVAPIAQKAGAAVLVEDRPEIVGRSGADGAHLTGIAALAEAIGALKPAHIAGVGGLRTRHDAMEAAEREADYVLFGEPGPDGRMPPFEVTVERVGWWAEVFESPCVGYATTLDEVSAVAAAGADFVALDDRLLDDPRGAAAALADAAGRLGLVLAARPEVTP